MLVEEKENLYDKTPFYMTYPIQNLYLAEMEYEKDMERMKELYPREVQQILKLVEKRCDELEQEGSRMYDENPDRYMMEKEACRIYEQFVQENPKYQDVFPRPMPVPMPVPTPMPGLPPRPNRFPINPPEEFRDMLPRPIPRPEQAPVPQPMRPMQPESQRQQDVQMQEIKECKNSWLCTLINVIFNDEMYRRRCRNRRCRRWSM